MSKTFSRGSSENNRMDNIAYAEEENLPQILELVQTCYRGEVSKKGWTSEADILDGNRTTIETLTEEFKAPLGKLFKYTEEDGKISGCVYTEIIPEEKKAYVGMLCVHPDIQAKGIGRNLMTAAENHAKSEGCTKTCMKVITKRAELIAWYERRGYKNIGEMTPFLATGTVHGIPKIPLEFCTLEKKLE